jgi:hypothetical protein
LEEQIEHRGSLPARLPGLPRASDYAQRDGSISALSPRTIATKLVELPVRDNLLVEPSLVERHDPSHLFAYEVTQQEMRYLRASSLPATASSSVAEAR